MRGMLVGLLVLVSAGCATVKPRQMYEGPPRAEDRIARLLVPEVVQVLSVDGKDLDVRAFKLFGHRQELHLLPGRHRLTARYSVVLDLESEEHELFYAAPVTLEFDAEAGRVYRVAHRTGRLRMEGEERMMDVELWVEAAAAKNPEPLSRAVEPADAPVVAAPTQAATTGTGAARPARTGDVPDVRALDLLKVWWQRASQEERRAFLEWVGGGTE
jgi:uncharacterized protein YccT (UPF0319 family)